MSDSENASEIPENTSKSLGESQEVENENPQKEEIVKPRKKPPAINKDGTPRKTLTEEQQKARLETLRKGREKANHKRQILKEEALKKAKSELSKFKHMAPSSAEASVVRSYLDCLVEVPWKKKSSIKNDIEKNYWFTLNREDIFKYTGKKFSKYIIYLNGNYSLPKPKVVTAKISNNHKKYAITWFSMAISILLIYLYFRKKNY